MSACFQQHFTGAWHVREHGNEVGHRAARHEGGRFFRHALRGHRLELANGRVPSRESSPSVASRIDSSMASVGRVTVSLRRSIIGSPIPRGQDMVGRFPKSLAASPNSDVTRRLRDALTEVAHVRNADRMRKVGEHRRIVRRIADERVVLALGGEVDTMTFAHQRLRHRELVVSAVPSIHVYGAHFCGQSVLSHDLDDALDCAIGEARHVFAEIDGEIRFPVGLIGRDRRAGNASYDLFPDRG